MAIMQPGWSEKTQKSLERVAQINQNWQNNIIVPEDMAFLIQEAASAARIREIADISWASGKAEILAKDLEIAELVRQLES